MELPAVAADGRDDAVRAVVAQTIAHGPRQDAAGFGSWGGCHVCSQAKDMEGVSGADLKTLGRLLCSSSSPYPFELRLRCGQRCTIPGGGCDRPSCWLSAPLATEPACSQQFGRCGAP
jgi:hypothetical protein